jgi:hypothetical protein
MARQPIAYIPSPNKLISDISAAISYNLSLSYVFIYLVEECEVHSVLKHSIYKHYLVYKFIIAIHK